MRFYYLQPYIATRQAKRGSDLPSGLHGNFLSTRNSPSHVLQELGSGARACDEQVVAGPCAGHVEELSLRVKLPMAGWHFVRRIEDGLVEKRIGWQVLPAHATSATTDIRNLRRLFLWTLGATVPPVSSNGKQDSAAPGGRGRSDLVIPQHDQARIALASLRVSGRRGARGEAPERSEPCAVPCGERGRNPRSTRPARGRSGRNTRRARMPLGRGTPNTEVNVLLRRWYGVLAECVLAYCRLTVGE
jgi:hypothetical protein